MRQRLTSDDDLMQAAAAGNAAAFTEIVKRHQGWVRALMIAFVHDAEQAEDLAQDAFCRAFQHVRGYDPQGQFTAWLKRIAINRAKDFLRRQKQATFVPLHEWEEMPATDRRGDPMAALATGALRDDLRGAIERLTAGDYRRGLASTSSCDWVDFIVDGLQVRHHFHALVAGDEVAVRKPAPDVYLRAAERLGVTPGECVALEDSAPGVASARAAGMACIAVPNRVTVYQDLTAANHQVAHLGEVTLELLRSL